MKSILNFLTLFTPALLMMTLISCGDDDDGGPAIDPLVGTYVIASAVLAEDLVEPGGSTVLLPANTNITLALNGAFLTAAGCTDLANARIELRNDATIWYTCLTEGIEFQNGTWGINSDRNQLNLALNIQGQPFALNLTNFDEATLSGLVNNLPLTPAIILAVDPTLMGLTELFYPVNVNITLAKD